LLTIGSLFSGIGGLDLGLERAGLGPVLFQVEIDPFCRAVLAKHWPKALRHDDVRTVGRTATLPRVDLLCGGFPCQDVSGAGKGAGLEGERSGLWFEFHRIVAATLPRFVVVENVASGKGRYLCPECIAELERRGQLPKVWREPTRETSTRLLSEDIRRGESGARCTWLRQDGARCTGLSGHELRPGTPDHKAP
jgi:C-5 cytosine-specific DNA methylase